MPASKISKAKRKPKPNEYPDLLLKTLVEEYESKSNVWSKGMPETTLAVKAGVDPDGANFVGEVMEAVRVLINKGYIEIAGRDGVARLLKPTCEGTNCVHWQTKWFHKAAHFIREVWVAAIEGVTKGLTKP